MLFSSAETTIQQSKKQARLPALSRQNTHHWKKNHPKHNQTWKIKLKQEIFPKLDPHRRNTWSYFTRGSDSLNSYPGTTLSADIMASSTACRKSSLALRSASCHKHTHLSLLSIAKICLDVPWQFPACLKLSPPPSLTPALNVYRQSSSPTLPHTSPSWIKAPAPLHEVSQTLTIYFQFLRYTSGDNGFILA